jgi:cysteine-rich repeat protein
VDLRAETATSDTNVGTCNSIDTILTLFGPDGTTTLISDDNDGAGNCSIINSAAPQNDAAARRLAPGTYFLKVEDKGNNTVINTYFLHLKFNSVCGDTTIAGTEQCDDGNLVNGDGCEANCTLTPVCGDGQTNVAGEQCGDGITQGPLGETCDDGNFADGDGCRADCSLELCGDGILDPQEECDDTNTANGDGCDATCAYERTVEIEPNDLIAQADATGINLTTDQLFLGAISSIGDKDIVKFTLTQTTQIHLETFDDLLNSCVGIDTEMEVFNSAGTKIASIDDGGIGNCSALTLTLGPGTFFVRVHDFDDDDLIPAYSLLLELF